MKRFFSFFAAFFVLFPATALFAQEGYRVIEVVGRCEILEPQALLWQPLQKGSRLVAGSTVRTGSELDTTVELATDPHFENALHIGPASRVGFLSILPLRISLDNGSIFVLKEEQQYLGRAPELSTEVRILTRDFLVGLRQGGCELDTTGTNVVLRAFAESVQVQPKAQNGYESASLTVEEGFCYSKEGRTRLEYPDYRLWQAWYKKSNEKRDALARSAS